MAGRSSSSRPRRGTRTLLRRRMAFGAIADRTSIDLLVLVMVLLACLLGGGTAFADTPSLLYVRPTAVLALVLFMLTPARADWRAVRAPMLMLATLALIMVAQLVPLPPAIWLALPGHAPYAEAASLAGLDQPWRPISLTPDLTLNSLASLLIPAAILTGFAKIDDPQRHRLVIVLVSLCCASAILGIAQFAGGRDSVLYLYRRTYEGFPVGFLSNRNHQAALLALVFPALRVWLLHPPANPAARRRRIWLALAIGGLAVPVILATGSRAGMAVAGASLGASFLAFPAAPQHIAASVSRQARWLRFGIPALLLALVVLSYGLGRAVSIERLSSGSAIADDERFRYAPVVVRIVKASFPIGTGFGSFDPVFRQYEPDAYMISTHFNHAHDELLELAMTAGLPGLVLLAVFVAWWAVRVTTTLRLPHRERRRDALVLLGGTLVLLLMGASLVDYPLRTPLLSAVFAMACGWMGASRDAPRDSVEA